METGLSEIGSSKMFDGYNKRYKHYSQTLGCSMTFSVYFPPCASSSHRFPVLYWLSGLTCTDENFIIKSGAQRAASSHGIALVAPDTCPRGLNIEGEADSYDFGVGAGFYLNATQEKWKNWRMYDYLVKELPKLLSENFSQLDTTKASISGHSMGGHGALTIYLKNLDKYKSVSAFAPIANPINCAWGQKGFTNYLSPVLASKIEEAEEHSCSSLVSDQVSDPIKLAPEDKSSSAISQENIGGSTLMPLVLETGEKMIENGNAATNEDGEISKDFLQSDSLQDIVAVSEPFTTESLLEMCDEPDKRRETSCDEKGKISHPEAVKTVVKDAVKTVVVKDAVKTVVVKDELIINLLTEARQKSDSSALLKAGSVLLKKRQSISNSSMNTSFIRNTKQKVGGGGEAGEVKTDPAKKSKPEIIRASTLDLIARIRQTGVISASDLMDKTGKELRSIAKELKITHYYKLKKEELLQRLTMQIESQLTDCTKQRMET